MNTTSEIEGNVSVELRIKGERANPLQPQWACLRFLGEAEIVDLLQDRLGKSEAEVRHVLESFHRAPSSAGPMFSLP
jgi:hypothetical protein